MTKRIGAIVEVDEGKAWVRYWKSVDILSEVLRKKRGLLFSVKWEMKAMKVIKRRGVPSL